MDIDSEDPIAGAKVLVKGKVIGTITNDGGEFTLSTAAENFPMLLVVSEPGYGTKEVMVQGPTNVLIIRLQYQALMMGQDLVISASRIEESIQESPVSIEKIDILDVRSAAALSFYDQIVNLKAMDVSTQSLAFKTINPRGFGINGNVRTVQLVDGIDNQAPGLNFPAGNFVGVPELDLESVEVLPGAASALYGPNALNGIILMNSKNPFEYQGLSATVKLGGMHLDGRDQDPTLYQSYGLRYARAYNDRLAFKITGEWLRAGEFYGVDYRDQQNGVEFSELDIDPTRRMNRRTYDGVNVYGDPLLNLGIIAQSNPLLSSIRALFPLDESGDFTPTGYTESTLIDNFTESIKVGGAVHYRINDQTEVLAQYNFGTGNSVFTATDDRFVLDDFAIHTAKAELRGQNFFLRAYRTYENSGDTYAANTLASLINAQTTIPRYVETFAGSRIQGSSVSQAHLNARAASDALRAQNLANGRFQELYDSLRVIPISEGGARFLDRTSLWHYEGMYDFSTLTDAAEIVAGASFRRYALRSDGTLFALQDNGDEFNLDEWGAYVQVSKDVFDRLDLTGSVRYDKHENFKGQFSPRISGVYTLLDNHYFRASFQRGFRIPTNQNQLIDIVGQGTSRFIGNNPVLIDRYNLRSNQAYTALSVAQAQENFSTTNDVAGAVALLDPVEFEDFDTEKVSTYEIGYRGLFNQNLFIDAYGYFSAYSDLVINSSFVQSAGTANDIGNGGAPWGGQADPEGIVQDNIGLQRFVITTNADGTVDTYGFAVGVDYALPRGFTLGGNVAYIDLLRPNDPVIQRAQVSFNTPKWRYNLKLANRKVTDNFGFNLIWRWQDTFFWESAFGQGIIPAYQTLDAQVSYKVPALKSVLKLGGSNVLNERYTTSFGNPRIGAIYYVSITFDQFLN